jgi:uncharacterized protein with FMN-binding domain
MSTISAVVLLFSYHTSTSGPLATSSTTSVQSPVVSSTKASGSTSGGSTGSGSSSSGSAASSSKTVTGSTVQTRWGPVQVQLTIAAGKITQVSVIQYPSGNGKDEEINSYALPTM